MRHQDLLRDELVAAHRRRRQPARPPANRPTRRPLLAAAAAVLVAVAAAVWQLTGDARPAAADVFVVRSDGTAVVVDVVDTIDDPEAAAAELYAEGFTVEMVARPVAPDLVGAVIAVAVDDGTVDVDIDGAEVHSFRVAGGADVRVEYGRAARGDEPYAATTSAPDCAELAGQPVTAELLERISRQYGPDVRVLEFGAGDIDLEDVVDGAELVDIQLLSASSALVVVTDGTTTAPDGLACS